jgi:hypothetical protein
VVTATVPVEAQPGGPSNPTLALHLGGPNLNGEIQHILIHNDLLNANIEDGASLFEAISDLNKIKTYSGPKSNDPANDAAQNAATPIPITWAPSPPPLKSTCGT